MCFCREEELNMRESFFAVSISKERLFQRWVIGVFLAVDDYHFDRHLSVVAPQNYQYFFEDRSLSLHVPHDFPDRELSRQDLIRILDLEGTKR